MATLSVDPTVIASEAQLVAADFQEGASASALGLPPAATNTAEQADFVATETLEGAATPKAKPTQSFLACVLDPVVNLWEGTIKPTALKVMNWVRDHVFFLCCPATPRVAQQAAVRLEAGQEMTLEQAFKITEGRRFADRDICATAGVTAAKKALRKAPVPQTLSNAAGIALKAVIDFDTNYVGGQAPAANADAITTRLAEINVRDAFIAFGKLATRNAAADTPMQILTAAYNADATIEGYENAEQFAEAVLGNQEVFGKHLSALRDGLASYFHTKAEEILTARQSRQPAVEIDDEGEM